MHSTIFHEDWWMNCVSGGKSDRIVIERGSNVIGWLPFAIFNEFGLSACGTPHLARLSHPVILLDSRKTESFNRGSARVISEMIRRLPRTHYTKFVIGPVWSDALAWQMNGFDTRVEHTFVLDFATSHLDPWRAMRDKTRNIIRRAQERLTISNVSAQDFVEFYQSNLPSFKFYYNANYISDLYPEVKKRGQGEMHGSYDAAGVLQAAVFFVWDERDYYYFLSARNRSCTDIGATSLLVWHGILEAKKMGLRFDFDGVTSPERMQFMVGYGGHTASRFIVEKKTPLFMARQYASKVNASMLGFGRSMIKSFGHRIGESKKVDFMQPGAAEFTE